MNTRKISTLKLSKLFTLFSAALIAFALAGCDSMPWQDGGDNSGASASLVSSLVSFTNNIPGTLVDDISNIKDLQNQELPVEIAVGDIENNTKINFRDHFPAIATRLSNKLISSTSANQKVRFVGQSSKMSSESGYVLSGDLDKSDAPSASSLLGGYFMQFQITKPSGDVVFSKKYSVK